MPAQMPPTRSISGEVRSMITMSSPGAIPSSRTPTTSPVNGSGVVPLLTVSPSTGSSASRSAIGNGSAQSGVGSADRAAPPENAGTPATRPTDAVSATRAAAPAANGS